MAWYLKVSAKDLIFNKNVTVWGANFLTAIYLDVLQGFHFQFKNLSVMFLPKFTFTKGFLVFSGESKGNIGKCVFYFFWFCSIVLPDYYSVFLPVCFFLRKNLSCKVNNKDNKNIFRIFCQFFSKLTIKPSEQHSNNLIFMNNFVDKFNLVNKFVHILRICYTIRLGLLLSDYLMNGKENTM